MRIDMTGKVVLVTAAAALWPCSEDPGCVGGTTPRIDGGKLAGAPPLQVMGGRR